MSGAGYELHHGDCLAIMPTLAAGSVQACVTSPPYAEQRKEQYGGVPEDEYPAWTVAWMEALRPALAPGASVLINIREHVRDGQISDYVHRTRLAVRAAGWAEIDEIIWAKPYAPPVGHPGRPRRSWERVLWFALDGYPRCFPQANGQPSKHIGMTGSHPEWVQGRSDGREGVARCRDYVEIPIVKTVREEWHEHSASFPVDLPAWLVRLVTEAGDLVVDPFMGSGTTGVAALVERRRFWGCDKDASSVAIARRRIGRPARELRGEFRPRTGEGEPLDGLPLFGELPA